MSCQPSWQTVLLGCCNTSDHTWVASTAKRLGNPSEPVENPTSEEIIQAFGGDDVVREAVPTPGVRPIEDTMNPRQRALHEEGRRKRNDRVSQLTKAIGDVEVSEKHPHVKAIVLEESPPARFGITHFKPTSTGNRVFGILPAESLTRVTAVWDRDQRTDRWRPLADSRAKRSRMVSAIDRDDRVVAVSTDNGLAIRDVETGEIVQRIATGGELVFSTDRSRMAVRRALDVEKEQRGQKNNGVRSLLLSSCLD